MIKESFQIVGKTDDEIDKLKSLRIGLHRVDAQNIITHSGSPSAPSLRSLKKELFVITGVKIQFSPFKGLGLGLGG